MQNLLEELKKLLEQDERLVVEGKLLKNKIIESALKLDIDLIRLLLKSETIKTHFFQEVDGVLVFDKIKFQKFVSNKEFLPDSYTSFKNKIGLVTENEEYLSEGKEAVLVWPYKDCVLEGGQEREDEKRNEIFYNEVLAPDEIDRLLEPKVLTNFKRIDINGEHKVTEIKKNDNLIIRGNNLLALYSLQKRFASKVKLIYIDPPYNTGNDEFKYNDSFRHSTWLTFMKNRLKVAKELLKDDGVIFVQCDDNEQAYLKVLMDEIFKGTFLNTISIKAKVSAGASGGGEDKRLKKNIEYIHCYYKNSFIVFNDVFKETEIVSYIEQMKNNNKSFKYTQVLMSIGDKKHFKTIKDGSGEDIIIYKHSDILIKTVAQIIKEENLSLKDVYKKYFNEIFTTTNAQSSIRQRVWDVTGNKNEFYSIEYIPKSGRNKGKLMTQYYTGNKKVLLVWFSDTAFIDKKNSNVIKKEKYGTFWDRIDYNNLNKEGDTVFPSGKKPEQLLQRVIEMSTEKEDIVFDYHLGSGTTCAVAHKMGRRYIGIEQLDYGENDFVVRLKNVINGDQSGVSKLVNWQGGGDFIYCELMKLNEKYIDEIKKVENTKELLDIWKIMKEKAFLIYRVDVKQFDENVNEFEELNLENQKKFLIECLDKNQLYVNLSEIGDTEYEISKEDKELNKQFYGVM